MASNLGIQVVNRTSEPIFCSITNDTNPSGSSASFEIKPGLKDFWARTGWEDVNIKDRSGGRKTALWINRGAPSVVYFDGYDKALTIVNDYKPLGAFVVRNDSTKSVYCSVTTCSGGNDGWFKLMPGETEEWRREGWEMIKFKDVNDKDGDSGLLSKDAERKGVYVSNKGMQMKVEWRGFEKEVVVHEPPERSILQEHYEEATKISDRTYANGNSRASLEGGLSPSVYKVDLLETMAAGRNSLNNHNQIYTLALLINHLKYGLAEPALVVAVTPSWVKVAAYTCELDTIVLMGFPTAAVDQIAPDKKRPEVGARLLVVSQFTPRDQWRQGVQGDIKPGPKSCNSYYNFHPLVAQFVTDDSYEPIWSEKMAAQDADLWARVWDEWVAWKGRHGENYFRLGAPSKIRDTATNR